MKEFIYMCMDLIEYTVLGCLLAYLLNGMIQERFWWNRHMKLTSIILCLQFVIVRLTVSRASWAKQIIYGKDMYMVNSRQSIIPVAVSICGTLLAGMILYKGNRIKLLSLITAFYALLELIRFTFYPLAVKSIGGIADYYNCLLLERETMTFEQYQQVMGRVEFVWNGMMSISAVLFMWLCVRRYKKYLLYGGSGRQGRFYESFDRSKEAGQLFVPALLGLVFAVMLRSILFYCHVEICD